LVEQAQSDPLVAAVTARGRLARMTISGPSQNGDAVLVVRPALTDEDLNELFSASWPGHRSNSFAPLLARSLVWIAASRDGRLVGYVNVAGDGGLHAFILDTTVHPDERRQGLGVRLVRAAADEARACGAEWLHVDYEPHLESFYAQCGFRPTAAGLMPL
jgi:GNAT superfamily N-acetyltransferase